MQLVTDSKFVDRALRRIYLLRMPMRNAEFVIIAKCNVASPRAWQNKSDPVVTSADLVRNFSRLRFRVYLDNTLPVTRAPKPASSP